MVVLRRILRTLTGAVLIAWSAVLTVVWWQTVRAIEIVPGGPEFVQTLLTPGFMQTVITVVFVLLAVLVWFGVFAAALGSAVGSLFAVLLAVGWWALRYLGQIPQAGLDHWVLRAQDLWGAGLIATLVIALLLPWVPRNAGAVPTVTAEMINSTRAWGVPGSSVSDGDNFGSPNAPIGRVGDRRVGQRLEEIVDSAGARFVHALRFDGSTSTDVDHAVVVGRRVALVEVKVWQPGIYSWYGSGTLLRYGDRFRGGRSTLVEARRRCRALLGSEVEVRSFLVVTPVGDAEQHTYALNDTEAPAGVRMLRLGDLDEIADWLQPTGTGPEQAATATRSKINSSIDIAVVRSLVLAHRDHPASDLPALHSGRGPRRLGVLTARLRRWGRQRLRVRGQVIG